MSQDIDAFYRVLQTDHDLAGRFIRDPRGVMAEAGIDLDLIDTTASASMIDVVSRIEEALATLGGLQGSIPDNITAVSAIAARVLGPSFQTEFDPLGFTLLEKLDRRPPPSTATGTIRCTTTSWDGCVPDVDG